MKENIDLRESFRNRRRIHWKTDYRRWNSAHFINLLEHLPHFQWGNFLEQKNPWPLFNLLGGALQGASYDVTVSLYFPSNICQMLNGDLGISQCPRNCSVHGACPYVVNLSTHSHVCEKMCTFFRQQSLQNAAFAISTFPISILVPFQRFHIYVVMRKNFDDAETTCKETTW